MKKLVLLVFPFLVSCAAYDALTMTSFDGNEYQQITQIRVDASHFKNTCDDSKSSTANAITLARETELFEIYSSEIPHNDDSLKAAKSLNEIAQGLVAQYEKTGTVSPMFCKLKFEGIEHSASTMQHVLGRRPR